MDDMTKVYTKYITTSEAAKTMIDGRVCEHWGSDFRWNLDKFERFDEANRFWTMVTVIPQSDKWTIKKDPLKYSIDIWLDTDTCAPEFDAVSRKNSLARFLLGTTRWSRTGKLIVSPGMVTREVKTGRFTHRFRITVERIDE